MKRRWIAAVLALTLALCLVPAGGMAADTDRFFHYGEDDLTPGTYYITWNVNQNLLPPDSGLTGVQAQKAQAEIRCALALLMNRTELTPTDATPASSFVASGIREPDGSQFYQNAGSFPAFYGYFDPGSTNSVQAMEVLKTYYTYDAATGKFTDFPALTYLYNVEGDHQGIAQAVQRDLAEVGITLNLEETDWDTFIQRLASGDYQVARDGWRADYADPLAFLEIFTSQNGDNHPQLGSGDHARAGLYSMDLTPWGLDVKVENGTWAQTYDVLIDKAGTLTDDSVRFPLLHLAEDLLMSTGCVCPLYYYPYEEPAADPAPQPAAPSFDDVAPDAWYAKAVGYAVANGITNGTGENKFSPLNTCTNAHILTFLWRAAGEPEPGIDNPFSNNTDPGGWYYKAAIWAYEKGMVTGDTFAAGDPCTRASAVKFIWQAMDAPSADPSSFTDIAADAPYKAAVDWAVSAGVTDGVGNGRFAPDTVCNRGHIVTFLWRAFTEEG